MIRTLGIPLLAVSMIACTTADVGRSTARAPAAPAKEAATPEDSANSRTRSGVNIDPEIAKACNMPALHFDFDSAALATSPPLDLLAKCFTSGPMNGRAMKLVGRADPRGSEEYNIALGQRRAGSVQNYLARHGLPEKRVLTISRGSLDATGTNEKTWEEDRRVDVLLGD